MSDLIYCENCERVTEHHTIKEKTKGRSKGLIVKCLECNLTSVKEVHQEIVKLLVIFSWLNISSKTYIELESNEIVCVGDEFIIGENLCVVTAIEKCGKRYTKLDARSIDTLWVKRSDKIRVKVAVNFPDGHTISRNVIVDPKHEFVIKDKLKVGKLTTIIKKIKTNTGFRSKELAENIVRIYCSKLS